MCVNNHLRFFSVRGIRKTSSDVCFSQFGKLAKNLRVCHPRSKIFKNIVHGDAHSANARFPAAFARFDGNDVSVIHLLNLFEGFFVVQDIGESPWFLLGVLAMTPG